MTFDAFFEVLFAVGDPAAAAPRRPRAPFAYQRLLAQEPWPDILDIPTGLGKTAAITGAWLYRRLHSDADTPRRLVWCLPMRVLVEQTRAAVDDWLDRVAPLFSDRDLLVPRSHVLMGGEADEAWAERPEEPAILIGTQDMLLSRALMRGYGVSRYRWPMDFALLHNDALWVLDEVQLMGAGLATTAQLEGFRRGTAMPAVLPCRTLWASATLRPEWLDTVDFRPHLNECRLLRLPDEDRADPRVLGRLSAPKRLEPASVRLAGTRKSDVQLYFDTLCDDILATHAGNAPTLVIVNRVARAQELYRRISARALNTTSVLLVHARFRAAERGALNERLRALSADDDVIVIATQAVEAGVDITSRNLFTELAPWASLVQRFGRCNRGGEYDDALVRWIDIDEGADAQLALPYTAAALTTARSVLERLDSASSATLPPVEEQREFAHVLRRKDFLDLFNTEADLSGFDIDISPYLRDPGGAGVQFFWREFESPDAEPRPRREELCTVSIGTARDHLRTTKGRAYFWNALDARWVPVDARELRPGQVLMLHATGGGYDPSIGFLAGLRVAVAVIDRQALPDAPPDSMEGESLAARGGWVELGEHLMAAKRQAVALAEVLPMAGAEAEVIEAAFRHDVGKAHPAFQTALLEHASDEVDRTRLWAKSPHADKRLNFGIAGADGRLHKRRGFRHELASMLAWLELADDASVPGSYPTAGEGNGAGRPESGTGAAPVDVNLVAYLIVAHHGKVRLMLRALPTEARPGDDRLFARGVWAGDELPELRANGTHLPPLSLRLDVMRLGDGSMGASWTARTAALIEQWGPFSLAWLETMVRLADWRASATPVQGEDAAREEHPN
jgi:CRISPR-associated endonuclease/helicase Cas3